MPDEYSGSFVALESDNAQVRDTQVNLITIWILENKPIIPNAQMLSKTLTKKFRMVSNETNDKITHQFI